MAGVTDTQSLRFGTVDDVITHTMQANLADDIATQLAAADTARTAALKRPQVKIQRGAALNVPVTTLTTVPFDAELVDTHGMVDLAGQPQRVTCNSSAGTGIYQVRLYVQVDTTSWTKAEISVSKNGSLYVLRTFWGPQSFAGMEMETDVYLGVVTDYLTFSIYHDGGGTTATVEVLANVQKLCDG